MGPGGACWSGDKIKLAPTWISKSASLQKNVIEGALLGHQLFNRRYASVFNTAAQAAIGELQYCIRTAAI